jgi:hypothetical protein
MECFGIAWIVTVAVASGESGTRVSMPGVEHAEDEWHLDGQWLNKSSFSSDSAAVGPPGYLLLACGRGTNEHQGLGVSVVILRGCSSAWHLGACHGLSYDKTRGSGFSPRPSNLLQPSIARQLSRGYYIIFRMELTT